ncbi:MAG: hypothetical protein AUK48_15200 [Oscillatoriales cyanobacterium CG2_30_44_21]|nr:MAG: hypothetical protein AUK48_15200 [Oscillatoriales cyanobacterium CG2_30_44_21]
MEEVLSSFFSGEAPEIQSITAAMLASSSLEETLKIFLVNLGEKLAVDRVAVYHFINSQEGKILIDAVSPEVVSIKNQSYSINYLGVDSQQTYPRDRPVILEDMAQITDTLAVHQQWQMTNVKSMMSAPILFNSPSLAQQIWGITLVQQCDVPRRWQSGEAHFLMKLSQVFSKCLQYWQLRLRELDNHSQADSTISNFFSPPQSNNQISAKNEPEEFAAIRTELFQELETSESLEGAIAWTNATQLSDDDENPALEKNNSPNSTNLLNQAINLALEKLDWRLEKNSEQYAVEFDSMDKRENIEGIDAESATLENILQDRSLSQNYSEVEYLRQKISELIDNLQKKTEETVALKLQIKALTASHEELQKKLLALSSQIPTKN